MAAPAANRTTPATSNRRRRRVPGFVKTEGEIRSNLPSNTYYNYGACHHVNISVNTKLTPGRLHGLVRERHHHRCPPPPPRAPDGRGGGGGRRPPAPAR